MTNQTIESADWNASVEQLLTEARERPDDELVRRLMNRLHEARLGIWSHRKQQDADRAAAEAQAALERERQPEWDRQRDALRELVIASAAEVAAADSQGGFDRYAFERLMTASRELSRHAYDEPRRKVEARARLSALEATDQQIQRERRGGRDG